MTDNTNETKPTTNKGSRSRSPHITLTKHPLHLDAYYTARELTDKASPYYQFSAATLFRVLPKLNPKYIGRKLLIQGASIISFIEGGETNA